MTITYDPHHRKYLDEADVRAEMTRVFDVCQECRRCSELCVAFPSLFEMIERHDDRDAGRMTPSEQDRVVEECWQCKRCVLGCPYTPALHELSLDFPRLMLRAAAMRHDVGLRSPTTTVATQVIGRTDLVGRLGSATAPLSDKLISTPGSLVRKLIARVTGVSAVRRLPPFAAQRFSTWCKSRQKIHSVDRQGSVTVFPTCLVEYQEPGIGQDLVRVYERNGIDCAVSEARCCGAPWLHAGDIERFAKVAAKNVASLAAEVRRGTDVVVAQPSCCYVLTTDYLDHVGGPDAELVAEHTYDVADYLMRLHRGEDTALDTEFPGEVVEHVTYHVPCHLRALQIGLPSRDLMQLTGARVKLVQQCSGVDGLWSLRAENDEISVPVAQELGSQIERAGGDLVAGDCHLANTVIREQTGRVAQHPIQVVARAYGILEE